MFYFFPEKNKTNRC